MVRGTPRRCRVSQARTTDLVRRAAASWGAIFDKSVSGFEPRVSSCADLASEVKKFLAECPSDSESERMAWQSIKKLLPPSCSCRESGLLTAVAEGLSRPPRVLPRGYLAFVRETSRRFFSKGWDSAYEGFCLSTSPPIKGTTECGRRDGGTCGYGGDQSLFLAAVLGDVAYEPPAGDGQLLVVQSAGKPRPLTKFSSEQLLLRPLHKTLYARLSRTPWLCRGDPTSDKLKRAGFSREKGVLVSGDYKSATDNLSIEVAEEILAAARRNSVFVPESVWRHAMSSLRPNLWSLEHGIDFRVTTGQMMGSFLSFPLLCFQNFLAFRWACRRFKVEGRLPLMINGDDILFQSTECFARQWMSTVEDLGLEVERTKTSVSAEFGTLNSTLFVWKDEALTLKHTLRLGMLRSSDYPTSLGASFHSFLGDLSGPARFRAGLAFFQVACGQSSDCPLDTG